MNPRVLPNRPPAAFPQTPFTNSFPQAAAPVVARTVFVTWQLGQLGDATYGALCACGTVRFDVGRQLLRKRLGAHSCVDALDGPVELVPIDDVPSTSTLERVLAGLRAA